MKSLVRLKDLNRDDVERIFHIADELQSGKCKGGLQGGAKYESKKNG